jgi:2-polyprenyl-6-methoxyphenol hydroxylase-like FAD-dependent oxidoreductase
MEDVVIIGAGISGLATAVGLSRVGVRALVLERSDCLRSTGAALTLFPSAWIALHALGASHTLIQLYQPFLKGSVTSVGTGAIQQVSYGGSSSNGGGGGLRTIHRSKLLEALANELPAGTIRFSSKLVSVQSQGDVAIINLEDGTLIKAKVLIGCDGVHSVVGRWLGLSEPIHSGRSAVRGLAVFPQGHNLNHEIKQFLGEHKRAGVIPLNDTDVYWFLTFKSPPQGLSGEPEYLQREIIENYAKEFPSAYLDIVKNADLSTLTCAPLMLRPPWKIVTGNLTKENITIAGDAMHPMTPDLGQGGCSALEDGVVFSRHIALSRLKNGGRIDAKEVIRGYLKERKWRVAWLVTASYLSGWAQQDGSNLLMKCFRYVFYRFIWTKAVSFVHHDCGQLPNVSFDGSSKLD